MKQPKNAKVSFRFIPHSIKQEDLVCSDAILTLTATGTQWGKSLAGACWMTRQIKNSYGRKGNFLLMAPTYKIMQQSMLPYFLKLMELDGQYHKVDSTFELLDGRRVYFRTETDPDSIVGIPNVLAYWLDEANKVSLYFHENIQARAASIGARGLYTTSPYSRNWMYKQYIRPHEENGLDGVKVIQAASWENPYHTLHKIENRERMLASMDLRRFQMLFGGEWGKQAGLVYDCFDDTANICDPFKLPNGTVYYAGIDWGHTEPFVIVVRAITPDHRHYQVSEFYKSGMTVPEQLSVAKQKMYTWDIKRFFCGHERPENILYFQQNGLSCEGVPEKDIQVGTDLHYELIKARNYKVFRNTSPNSLDEYDTYHYPEPEDLKPDQDSDDQLPVGQYDHAMSANRFITLRTYKSHLTKKPFTPDEGVGTIKESQEARLKRLMKKKGHTGGTGHSENWS